MNSQTMTTAETRVLRADAERVRAQQDECAHVDVRQVSEHDVECRCCGLVSA